MSQKFMCDRCGVILEFPKVESEQYIKCPTCGNDSNNPYYEMVELSATEAPGAGFFSHTRNGDLDTSSPTDIKILPTGIVATILTVIFYVAINNSVKHSYVGELLTNRGWVPYVIILLTIWSGVILAIKYVKLNKQLKIVPMELLPRLPGDNIAADNAHLYVRYIQSVYPQYASNFLTNRIIRALQHFRCRGRSDEVAERLKTQAEADLNAVESSYSMVKVFIWAVPILGFIGTVLGIGQAVDGFAQSIQTAQNFELLKESLGSVTTGLAVAFDTTLLALVMSLVIMFPTNTMQKAEEDFLITVDDYCNDHLLTRISDLNGQDDGSIGTTAALTEAITNLNAQLIRLREGHDDKLPVPGDSVSLDLARNNESTASGQAREG